jgi:hypothetical protein
MTYREHLKSERYLAIRREALRRDRYRCRINNCIGTQDNPLEVHHREYPRFWADDCADNLTTVCAKHHRKITLMLAEERNAR